MMDFYNIAASRFYGNSKGCKHAASYPFKLTRDEPHAEIKDPHVA